MSAPPFLVELVDIGIANVDLSFQGRIIAEHQTDEGGLSTARRTNDGCYLALRNVNVYIVYGLAQSMWVILEHNVLDVNAFILVLNGSLQTYLSVLIIHLVNLIDTLQANLHILQRIEEVHQLLHRGVELTDDVLHGKHHTECHLPMNYGSGCNYRNDDVLYLVDENTSCLLRLLEFE